MSALDTFRRAMRRHEKRARKMGLHGVEVEIQTARADPMCDIDFASLRRWVCSFQGATPQHADMYRRAAFLYALAADAVAKLRRADSA